jgi:hypothetical protein
MIIEFNQYVSSRKTINDINDELVLIKIVNKSKVIGDIIFIIFNKNTEKAIGYISYTKNNNICSVDAAMADKGYGPILYEIVLTDIYPLCLTLSTFSTNDEAKNVWNKFIERSDVKKIKINDNEPDILKNLKFQYSFGKDILVAKIKEGDIFIKYNPDSNLGGYKYMTTG